MKGKKNKTIKSTLNDDLIRITSCKGYSEDKYFIETSFKEKQNIAPMAYNGPKSFGSIVKNLDIFI